jgi:hypothetical protein
MIAYIDLDVGCSLIEARTLKSAIREALGRHGSYHVRRVRPATVEDVRWISGMGGWVPEQAEKKIRLRLKRDSSIINSGKGDDK